jgi:hypothetical protein
MFRVSICQHTAQWPAWLLLVRATKQNDKWSCILQFLPHSTTPSPPPQTDIQEGSTVSNLTSIKIIHVLSSLLWGMEVRERLHLPIICSTLVFGEIRTSSRFPQVTRLLVPYHLICRGLSAVNYVRKRNRGSVVGVVTRLCAGRLGFDSRYGKRSTSPPTPGGKAVAAWRWP